MRAILLSTTLTLLLAAHAGAHPGPSGHVHGQVLDTTGAGLPGATVEVFAGGQPLVATASGPDGRYSLEGVPAGRYDVSVRLLGFATAVRRAIDVPPGGEVALDATLHVTLAATVLVTARSSFRSLSELSSGDDLVGVAVAASSGIVPAARLAEEPAHRPGDLLENVPGVVVSQHSGEGKANQYYVRGFNLDHGTDLALSVAGLPVNMPTHAHGQGYADANFLVPELVAGIQFKKGPYHAEEGDFSAAGAVNMSYLNVLPAPLAVLEGGSFGWQRALLAASPALAGGHLLGALELAHHDGPWAHPDDSRKLNAVLRFSRGDARQAFSVSAMGYEADWNATDQIPRRAIGTRLGRFGAIDPTGGGNTHRWSLSADGQRRRPGTLTDASAYVLRYSLNLWSNFTYALDDAENGDQFEQEDARTVLGGRASHRWLSHLGPRELETVAGLNVRHDEIGTVGLYHTRGRQRLFAVRADSVRQTSGAAFAQSTLQAAPWLRATAGLRLDHYRFEVEAGDPANAGLARDGQLSPKLALALGPWARTEVYLNAGQGFHSNDARGTTITRDPGTGAPARPVDPLVRARGPELGLRTLAAPGLHATVAVWGLWLDSELLFVGDAGTTDASRPSRRWGVETTGEWRPSRWAAFDASVGWSQARFTDPDVAGHHVPGSASLVASTSLTLGPGRRFSGNLHLRYFGPRPLVEDDSVRSAASTLLGGRVTVRLTARFRLYADAFNLLDAEASDVDYFYESRLPGEDGPVADVHTHPLEPRGVRFGISANF